MYPLKAGNKPKNPNDYKNEDEFEGQGIVGQPLEPVVVQFFVHRMQGKKRHSEKQHRKRWKNKRN